MTVPFAPPQFNWKKLPAEAWQEILMKARTDFHKNPENHAAKMAMEDATAALQAYDHSEDNTSLPAETDEQRATGGLRGVAQTLLSDVPKGIKYMFSDQDEGSVGDVYSKLLRSVNPMPALGNLRDVAQRSIAGENVSGQELGRAASGAALPLLTPMTMLRKPSPAPFRSTVAPVGDLTMPMRGAPAAEPMPPVNRAPLPPEPMPLGAEQFGGPSVVAQPTGAIPPVRAPLPPDPMAPVFDQYNPTQSMPQPPYGPLTAPDTPLPPTAPASPPSKFSNPAPIPSAGTNEVGAPRGLTVEGPATPPKPTSRSVFEMQGRSDPTSRGPAGPQKAVEFGSESPLSAGAKNDVKSILGEMARGLHGEAGALLPQWFEWQVLNSVLKAPIKTMLHGARVSAQSLSQSPTLLAMSKMMTTAYMQGNNVQAEAIGEQIAQQLLTQQGPQ